MSDETLPDDADGEQTIVDKSFLQARQTETTLIHVPDWKGWIRCKRLKVKERDEIFSKIKPGGNKDHTLMLFIVQRSLVEPKLSAAELEQEDAATIDQIATELMKLNGWSKEGQEKLTETFS